MELHSSTAKVLHHLRNHRDYVSGEALCQLLAISRAAVWKHVQILRRLGYSIESAPHCGYRLTGLAEIPYPWEIKPWLKTHSLGRKIVYSNRLESTNAEAIDRGKNRDPEGICVIADQQTRGRGRLQRQWYSPARKNLYLSILLRPAISPPAVPQISLIAALALLRALEQFAGQAEIRIKWPNDVFVNDKKIAGILCESASELDLVHYVVVGIGINVNITGEEMPPELIPSATSLQIILNHPVNRPRLAAALLNSLEPLYRQWISHGLDPFLPELEKQSWLHNREVIITTPRGEKRGVMTGLTKAGALRLYDPVHNREEIVYCGDIRVRPSGASLRHH